MRNDALICGRENDLIGFLYGELNEVEAIAFQRHLKECATCNAELADLGEVRESVVAWRNESLGSVAFPTQVTTAVPETPRATPSGVAALREFFNLSPLWMKGAVAFAVVLFCVFAGLAVARLRGAPSPAVAVAPAAPALSQQELKALVEQRVQEELKRLKNSEATATSPLTASDSSQRNPVKKIANPNTQVAQSASSQKARRPLSRTEREQLASDLRLVSAKNDGDLDLLDDRINQ
jgi:putative zinc finger protein